MKKTLHFGLFWLLLLTSSAFSSQDWSEKQEKDGIKIQTRKLQNQKYQEIRAETVIESSITKVFHFISDPNSCKKWVHRCRFSEALSLNDRNENVIYQLTKFPFPLKSREVFLSTKTTSNPDKSIGIRMKSIRDIKRDKSNFIEIHEASIEYLLEPTPKGGTRITWQQYVEPGGNLPTWAVDKENIIFVRKSLGNLKRIMALDKKNGRKLTELTLIRHGLF